MLYPQLIKVCVCFSWFPLCSILIHQGRGCGRALSQRSRVACLKKETISQLVFHLTKGFNQQTLQKDYLICRQHRRICSYFGWHWQILNLRRAGLSSNMSFFLLQNLQNKVKERANKVVLILVVLPNMEMRRRVFSSGESPELSSWLDKIQSFNHISREDEYD